MLNVLFENIQELRGHIYRFVVLSLNKLKSPEKV